MYGSVVEIRGDDMACFDWDLLRERLIQPCVDADLRVFDLSIERLNQINDTVTLEATQVLKTHNVVVKRATIAAENDVLQKYHLKRMWMSPNAAIRNILGGAVFREPKVWRNIPPLVKQWCKPIVIARHAFDYQRNGKDFVVPGPGIQIKYSPSIGAPYHLDLRNKLAEYKRVQGVKEEISTWRKKSHFPEGLVPLDGDSEGVPEERLALLEKLKALKEFYSENERITTKAERSEELWSPSIELERHPMDPSLLMIRGGRLLETKEMQRLQTKLSRLRQEIEKYIASYSGRNEIFPLWSKEFLSHLDSQQHEHAEEKQKERLERLRQEIEKYIASYSGRNEIFTLWSREFLSHLDSQQRKHAEEKQKERLERESRRKAIAATSSSLKPVPRLGTSSANVASSRRGGTIPGPLVVHRGATRTQIRSSTAPQSAVKLLLLQLRAPSCGAR